MSSPSLDYNNPSPTLQGWKGIARAMKLPEHQQWCKRHHALAMTIKTIKKMQKSKNMSPNNADQHC
jgi:hypothetical protein